MRSKSSCLLLFFGKIRNTPVRQAPLRCKLPDKIVTVDALASLINSKSRRLLHFNLLRYVFGLDFTPYFDSNSRRKSSNGKTLYRQFTSLKRDFVVNGIELEWCRQNKLMIKTCSTEYIERCHFMIHFQFKDEACEKRDQRIILNLRARKNCQKMIKITIKLHNIKYFFLDSVKFIHWWWFNLLNTFQNE